MVDDVVIQTITSTHTRFDKGGTLRLSFQGPFGSAPNDVSIDLCLLKARGENDQSFVHCRAKMEFPKGNINGSDIVGEGTVDINLGELESGVYQVFYVHINGMRGHRPFNSLLSSPGELRFSIDVTDPALESIPFQILPPPVLMQ